MGRHPPTLCIGDGIWFRFKQHEVSDETSFWLKFSVGFWVEDLTVVSRCRGFIKKKIKSPLRSRYYTEACNEWRDPSPRLSVWTTQLRRNIAAVASRWRHSVQFDRPRNPTQNHDDDSDVFNQGPFILPQFICVKFLNSLNALKKSKK